MRGQDEINIVFHLPFDCDLFVTFGPQLSQRAREIYNSFLSSKATTPVNIDSQAQLADDILNAPRPDMFKEQQLQVRQEVVIFGFFTVTLGVQHCISELKALAWN